MISDNDKVDKQFDTVLFEDLSTADSQKLDGYSFGLIGFGADYVVSSYNAVEAASAGLSPARVIGKHVFEEVAPCMNNFMIAQRFQDEPELDVIVPYVLTLRMRPTPVRLRLLQSAHGSTRYLLVERKAAT